MMLAHVGLGKVTKPDQTILLSWAVPLPRVVVVQGSKEEWPAVNLDPSRVTSPSYDIKVLVRREAASPELSTSCLSRGSLCPSLVALRRFFLFNPSYNCPSQSAS